MIDPTMFPDATSVAEVEATPENRAHVAAIAGPVQPDWSNAIMIGHPVYIIDGEKLRGYVPERNALTGGVKTYLDDDGHECIIAQTKDFPIPEGHPWHAPTERESKATP